jgi:hypothetical protein
MVAPYAATFDTRHPDTVVRAGTDARSWWRLLGEWEGPAPGAPRSISQLVASDPPARVLLILSEAYLDACLPDVREALTRSARKDQLSIICAGARQVDGLEQSLLPSNARLQAALGGARQSLNVRLAAHLLGTGAISHRAMKQRAQRLLKAQPPLQQYARKRLSDAEVRRFVYARMREDPHLSATRALRALRDAGYACEQSRFSRLFASHVEGAA